MSPETPPEGAEPARARPFVLTFTAPAALPWDQWRVIRLEAGHAAPLPEEDVHLSLRRLEPWRPGREGRFAAAFFRRGEVIGEIRHTEMLDGAPVEFTVQDRGSARRAARARYLPLICATIAGAMAIGSTTVALGDRERADAALEEGYQAAVRARSLGERAQRRIAEHRALIATGASGSRLADALQDVAWLSRARDPNATLSKIEWRPDGLLVEAVGPQAPIIAQDRQATLVAISSGRSRWRMAAAKAATSDEGAPP